MRSRRMIGERPAAGMAKTALVVLAMMATAYAGIFTVDPSPAAAQMRTTDFSLPFGVSGAAVASDGNGNVWLLGGDLGGGVFADTAIHVDLNLESVEYAASFYRLKHMGAAYLDGYVYTFGALDEGMGCAPQVYRYDTVNDQTAYMRNMVTNVYGTAAATDGNLIYVFGGYDESNGTRSNVIWQYDPDTNLLTRPAGKPVLPDGIAYSSAVWTGSEFIIIGGESNLEGYLGRVIVYDPDTRSAFFETKFGSGGWYDARMSYGVGRAPTVLIDGCVYQYGGDYWGNPTPSMQKYSVASKTAMMVADQLPASAMEAMAVAYGGKAYVFGGDSYGTKFDTINVHVPVDLTLHESMTYKMFMPSSPWAGGLGPIVANSNAGPVYIMGGYSGAAVSAAVYRYDPVSDQFALESATGLNTATCEAACAEYGGKFYIFGGNNSLAPISNIQSYTPGGVKAAEGTLTVATKGFKAVAYGTRIQLLGGDASPVRDTIYQYNPTTKLMEGVIGYLPYAVGHYGFAYDGKYAYLVGGKTLSGYSDDIIVYNPASPGSSTVYWNILPYPMWRCTAAYGDDGYVHIFGGRTSVEPYELSSHFIFDPATGKLDVSGAPLPAPCRGASASSGRICVVGGRTGGMYSTSIVSYANRDRGADGYSGVGEMFLEQDYGGEGFAVSAVAYHRSTDSLYMFGGTNDNIGYLNTIYRMSAGGSKPTLVGYLPADLGGASAAVIGDTAYIFGGYSPSLGGYTSKIFLYDFTTGSCVDTGKTLPVQLWGTTSVTDGTYIYVIGGRNSGTYSSTIYKWDPVSGSVVGTASMPAGLAFSVAGYLNGNVYVASGEISGGVTSAVYRYNTAGTTVVAVGSLPFGVAGARGGVSGMNIAVAGGRGKWGHSDRVMLFDTTTLTSRLADFRLAVASDTFSWTPDYDWAYGGYTDDGYPLNYPVAYSICLDRVDNELSGNTLARTLGYTVSHNAVAYNGQYVYSISGIFNAGTVAAATITRFDPAAGYTYANIGSVTYGGGTNGAACAGAVYDPYSGRIYYSGGYWSSTYWTGCDYISPTGTVTNLGYSMATGRSGHGMIARDGNIYSVAGQLSSAPAFTASVEVFRVGGTGWATNGNLQVSPSVTLSIGNFGYASDGRCMYIFGGQTGTAVKSKNIYRYDPYAKNLTKMQAALPTARNFCSAVYDPDQDLFLVMGGNDASGNYLSDICVYDPKVDALWMSGSTLPKPLSTMGATFDGPLIIGGLTTGAIRQNGVYAVDYTKEGPTGDDINSGPGGGDIIIQADPEPPQVYSYALKDSDDKECMNWQIEPGQEYYFEVEVGKNGVPFSDIDTLDVYCWFDYGSEASSYSPLGARNANMRFTYTNTTGLGTFTKVYPPAPDVTGFWGTERMLPVTDPNRGDRMFLRFYFTPSAFTRWADGCTGGSLPPTGGDSSTPANGYNDLNSWNVRFDVGDSAAIPQRDYAYDEFGVYKHQEITVVGGDPSVVATPGGGLTLMDTSNPGDFAYLQTRINCPFRLNVNVTDLEGAAGTVGANGHLAVGGGDLGGVTYFSGAYYQYRIYVRGADGGSWITLTQTPAAGYDLTALNWYVDVPTGIAEGTYTGYITYRMETASDPMASGSANHPPYNPTVISPGDGAFYSPNPGAVTLEVYAEDQDFDLCTVYFYNADTHALIGSDFIGAAPAWASISLSTNPNTTYRWYVVIDDGEEQMQSSVWEFTTGS